MAKPVKEWGFVPERIIVCPGGMEADFLYKRGDFLYWRGRMPLAEPGRTHRYILITDLDYKEVVTRDIIFDKLASYSEETDILLRR
jgi:hypothetical protein